MTRELPKGWRTVGLEALAANHPHALATGPFGSAIGARNFVDEGVPVIRGSNLSVEVGRRLVEDDYVFLTQEKAAEFSRSVARRGDLVFTCWGTIGQVGLVDRRARFDHYVVSNKQMKLTPDREIVDPTFLYYALASPDAVRMVQGEAIGSSVPGFNLGQLRALKVDLPPLAEQEIIAETLGALDDKIESNRRIAEVVDRLVRAEVSAMCSGSEMGTVADLVSSVRSTVQPESVDESTRYLGLEHMPRGRVILDTWGSAEGLGSAKATFKKGDILFGKLRPYFRKVGLAPPSGGICSTDILVLRPHEPVLKALALAVLASHEFIEFASNAASGTRMPRASWEHMKTFPVPIPAGDNVERLADLLDPLLAAAQRGVEESVVLAGLRDSLLPELLSGRLRIRGAGKMVESSL